uniref:Uncharacterized protein n=1 Tax=Cacopsylla melanoneura TaxID=428564 RepID=A0A8D8WB52_9HEMI
MLVAPVEGRCHRAPKIETINNVHILGSRLLPLTANYIHSIWTLTCFFLLSCQDCLLLVDSDTLSQVISRTNLSAKSIFVAYIYVTDKMIYRVNSEENCNDSKIGICNPLSKQ